MNATEMDERMPTMDQRHDSDDSSADGAKVVPIGESIRYRRRAQSAEKKAEDLAEQLTQANERIARMSEDLDSLQLDQKLARKLTAAGAIDLDAAVLIARTRMQDDKAGDVDACVEQLKSDKHYLFGPAKEAVTPRKTAGAKDRIAPGKTALERAATRAARTGHRTDVQEYLKLRRKLL
jgi:TolA-binding protein